MKIRIPVLVGLIVVMGLIFAGGWVSAAPSRQAGVGPLDVVINEVAWMGTAANATDEWIELYNNTDGNINLDGWTLVASDGKPNITLSSDISARSYYLIERTDNETVRGIPADLITSFGSSSGAGLANDGETLTLTNDIGVIIDTANSNGGPWPAGTASPGYYSMERVCPSMPDSDDNWGTNNPSVAHNGEDAEGNDINGTPKALNSATEPPTAINLVSFTAEADATGVTLAWETGTEVDNAGFNLYRAMAEDGPCTQINAALIAAQGDPVSGASYSFLDTPGYGTFYYQLEDVDYYGVSTLHGPVKATVARPFRRPLYRPTLPER